MDRDPDGAALIIVLALLEHLHDAGAIDIARVEAIVAKVAAGGNGRSQRAAETALLALTAFIDRQS